MADEKYRVRSKVTAPINQDVFLVLIVRDVFHSDDWTQPPVRQEYLTPEGRWVEYRPYSILEAALTIPGYISAYVGDLINRDTLNRVVQTQDAVHEALVALAMEAQNKVAADG